MRGTTMRHKKENLWKIFGCRLWRYKRNTCNAKSVNSTSSKTNWICWICCEVNSISSPFIGFLTFLVLQYSGVCEFWCAGKSGKTEPCDLLDVGISIPNFDVWLESGKPVLSFEALIRNRYWKIMFLGFLLGSVHKKQSSKVVLLVKQSPSARLREGVLIREPSGRKKPKNNKL